MRDVTVRSTSGGPGGTAAHRDHLRQLFSVDQAFFLLAVNARYEKVLLSG